MFYPEEIKRAYDDCIRTKKHKDSVVDYSAIAPTDLTELLDEINNDQYVIGPSAAFIVRFPKYREVFAASLRDRVVHHLVMGELLPYFEEEFIPQTYSCRKGKGVVYGVRDLYDQIVECTENFTKDAWILKMDIKSFFMSIDKTLLSQQVHNFIIEKYPNNRKKDILDRLCQMIILHHPEANCAIRCDVKEWSHLAKDKSLFTTVNECGMPIGNLTSQIFANFYLTPLDKFITEVLGFKYYGRYVDDFVIVSTDRKALKDAQAKIVAFAQNALHITIHENKRYLQHVNKGIQFIGSVVKPFRKYIINRTIDSLYYKVMNREKCRITTPEKLLTTVNSYMGFLVQCDTYEIRKRFFHSHLMKPYIEKYFDIGKGYKKLVFKSSYKKNEQETLQQAFDFANVLS